MPKKTKATDGNEIHQIQGFAEDLFKKTKNAKCIMWRFNGAWFQACRIPDEEVDPKLFELMKKLPGLLNNNNDVTETLPYKFVEKIYIDYYLINNIA